MSGRVRVSLIAVVAAVALVALIVPLQAGADGVNPASGLVDGGYLTLGFPPAATNDGTAVASPAFRWYQSPTASSLGAAAYAQTIGASGCTAQFAGDPLVDVSTRVGITTTKPTGTMGAVGLETGQSGVLVGLGARPLRGSGASGTPCGQVNEGESITLDLTKSGPPPLLTNGYAVDRAEIDVDAKYSVKIEADLYLNDRLVATRTLATNTSGSDSGPDCGGCDNFTFPISGAVFNKITLMELTSSNNNSAFAIAGGFAAQCAAGTDVGARDPSKTGAAAVQPCLGLRAQLNTTQSVFHLVQATGILDCTPPNNTSGDITGNGITTSVVRLGNADSSTCILVPYSLTTGTTGDNHTVSFRKDLGTQTSAQFLLNVTWPEEAAIDPPGTTHTTTITYDGTNYHAVKWCLPASDPPPPGPDGGIFPVWTPPTGESYCLVTHNEQLQSDGKVVVDEQFFGIGDPGLKR